MGDPTAVRPGEPGYLTTPERVREVAGNPDPVARNLQITQTYHELTLALDEHLGPADLAWPIFATWASKQAGSFIRNEEVPAVLRRHLGLEGDPPPPWTPAGYFQRKHFIEYTRTSVEDVSRNIGEGNGMVFAELGPLYVDLLALFRRSPRYDAALWREFAERMAQSPSHSDELERAIRHTYEAAFEGDSKRRAEKLFVANILVGYHEQARLQEVIDGAFSAPIRRALEDPERKWTDKPVPSWLRRLGAKLFRFVFAPAIRGFEDEWKHAATFLLMRVSLPTQRIDIGKTELPPLPDGELYPPDLRRLATDEAREVAAWLDRDPQGAAPAHDWSRLADRMDFLADFFRSRQQDRELLAPPFTPEQTLAIHHGEVPAGRL